MKKVMKTVLPVLAALLVILTFRTGIGAEGIQSVSRGQTLSYSITLANAHSGVKSLQFVLSFDESILTFTSGTWALTGTSLANVNTPNKMGVAAYEVEQTISGTIATVNFTVKSDAPFDMTGVSATVNFSPVGESETISLATVEVQCPHANFTEWEFVSEESHGRGCTDCTYHEFENHVWGSENIVTPATCSSVGLKQVTCSVCGYVKDVEIPATGQHQYVNCSNLNENEHQFTCTTCNSTITEAHTWDNGTVTTPATCTATGVKTYHCTKCDAEKTETIAVTAHTFGAWTKKDDTNHARVCSGCGLEETEAHAYSTDWKSDGTNHYHQCAACGDKKDETAHTPGPEPTETSAQVCTVCGRILKPALGHTHEWSTDWTTDENSHWHTCSGCNEKGDEAEHDFENACDPDCSICGYTREVSHQTELKSDETGHWMECTVCGLKEEKEEHVPGPEATETDPQVCKTCGYEIAPATGEGTKEESKDSGETQAPEKGGESAKPTNNNGWILPVVLGVVLVAGAVGAFFFVTKKKKKK